MYDHGIIKMNLFHRDTNDVFINIWPSNPIAGHIHIHQGNQN